jgi:hypothetical protein
MGFRLDVWKEIASYQPKWQLGDGKNVQLLIHFIGSKPLNHNNMMPNFAPFFGLWFNF